MLNEIYAHHGWTIVLGTLVCIVLLGAISLREKPRKLRPEPPAIFGPIRGMYVCYQCDTVFNTIRCPKCNEEAVIPLVHLTGSIVEDKRITPVIGKLQEYGGWKLPALEDKQLVLLEPACRPKSSNGVSKGAVALS